MKESSPKRGDVGSVSVMPDAVSVACAGAACSVSPPGAATGCVSARLPP